MSITSRGQEIASALGTGNKARLALGKALVTLNGAYGSVAAYNPDGLSTTGWGEDGVTDSGTQYLDGIRIRAEADFAQLPATDDPLPAQLNSQVGFDIASIEAATGIVADLGTSWGDLVDTLPDVPAGWSVAVVVAVVLGVVVFLQLRK